MSDQPINTLLIANHQETIRVVREALQVSNGTHPVNLKVLESLSSSNEGQLTGMRADVILVDLTGEGGHSLDVLDRLRVARPGLPLIVLGDSSDEELALQAIDAGAQDYLAKDQFDSTALMCSLRYAVRRARIREKLRHYESRYRSLVEQSSDGIMLTDEAGTIIEWNTALERITGIPRAEALGQPTWEIQFQTMTDEGKKQSAYERMKSMHLQFHETGQGAWVGRLSTQEIQRQDGERRFVQMSIFPIQTADGFMSGGIVRDVTDLRKAAEDLRTMMRIVEQSPSSVVVTDADGNIEYVNPKFTQLTGYTLEEVMGKNPRFLKSGYTPPEEYERLWETISAGAEWHGEFYNKKKNGELYWKRASISGVHNEQGQITHYVAVEEDVTDRKRAEEKLRYQARLLENVSDAIISTDLDFNIISWNKGAENLYNWQAEEVIGKPIIELLQPQSLQNSQEEVIAKFIDTGYWNNEDVHTVKDGSQIHVLVSAAVIKDQVGSSVGAVIVVRDITGHFRTKQALQESERFARFTVDALPVEIAILDEQGTILAVNQAWRDFAIANGADQSQTCEGAGYFAVCELDESDENAEVAAEFSDGIRAVMRGEQDEFSLEYPCHAPDERRWFTGRVTRFAGDGSLRIVVVHENVTERKLAESALEKANDQLILLNRIISIASASLDTETILELTCRELALALDVPQAAAALLNNEQTEATVLAEHIASGFPSSMGVKIPVDGNPVYQYLINYKIPTAIVNAQNDPRLTPVRGAMVKPGTASLMVAPLLIRGQILGSISFEAVEPREFSYDELLLAASVIQTISQALENSLLHHQVVEHNEQLEEIIDNRTAQLERLNERMAAILNNTSDAIILIDSDGKIENTNPAFNRLFDYEPDELFGYSMAVLADSPLGDKLEQAVQSVMTDGQPQRLQIMARRSDATFFDADVAMAPVADNDGHVVCSVRDITHLKEVERMKDHFISTVSHELRTPLTSIVLGSNSLKDYYERMTEEQRRKAIERTSQQALVLADLVEGILDISRTEARRGVRGTVEVDMCRLLEGVVIEFEASAKARSQTFETDIESPSAIVIGDEMDFARIWRNLIGNAIKYTPNEGNIIVRLGTMQIDADSTPAFTSNIDQVNLNLPADLPIGSYLVGQVKDNGHGIPPKDLEQLFTRFHRGWASQSNIPGTGLGLALVNELLSLYGGNISVSSELNAGSVFSFWLPIEKKGNSQ